jgi:bifunctional non-homologous end joining protein LigD
LTDTACSLRVDGGKATLKTRKGLDWSAKFAAIAHAAGNLTDAMIDGEIVALDTNGVPDFAALQAALSEGRTDDLVFFAFDFLFDAPAICANARSLSAKRDCGICYRNSATMA